MTRIKVLLSIFLGTFVYVFVAVGFGPQGIWASKQLEEQKQIITANLQRIQQLNDNLSIEFQGLRVDPDVIAAKARLLGYKKPGEKLIRINNFNPSHDSVPETGIPLSVGKINFIPEWLCKVSGLCIFFFFMAIFAMHDLRKKLNTSRETVTTTTVAAATNETNYYENPQNAF